MIVPSATDRKKISFILEFIEEREMFVLDLLSSMRMAMKEGDRSVWNKCLDSWYATAEIHAIPGMKAMICRSAARIPKLAPQEKRLSR